MRGTVVPYRQHPVRSTSTDWDSFQLHPNPHRRPSRRIVGLDRWGSGCSRLVELPPMTVLAVVIPFVGSACHSVIMVSAQIVR